MKDKILAILEGCSTKLNDPVTGYEKWIHESRWELAADEILKKVCRKGKTDEQKQAEQDYLEMFNRIKKSFCEKRNMKFSPTRVVSKPSQLHARLKEYTMDELGKVIYNAFNDQYHIETKWKHLSTEFLTRADKVEKYFL